MQLKPKLKATGIHLALSGAIFLIALYLIVFLWYPGFLFTSDGGWQGVRIMACVDLVLGPLLTLIIYNPLKTRRAILFDFTFIGVVQLGALLWGFYAVHEERPVALVHWENTFYPITVKSLRAQGTGLDELDRFGGGNPRLVYAKPPEEAEARTQLFLNAFAGGLAEYEQVQLFQKLEPYMSVVATSQTKIELLTKRSPAIAAALDDLRKKAGGGEASKDWVYVPFTGKFDTRVLVLNPQGQLVGDLPGESSGRE